MYSWYKIETPTETYYTCEKKMKKRFITPQKGTKTLCGEDMIEFLVEQGNDPYWQASSRPLTYFKYDGYIDEEKADLPTGIYKVHSGWLTPYVNFRREKFIPLPALINPIINSVERFLENKDLYLENGLIYKLGIMLYGPPGAGKSKCLNFIINNLIVDRKSDYVVLICDLCPSELMLKVIKETLKHKMVIFIFEEFAHTSSDPTATKRLLEFMDGELSIDNSIIFATTNYPNLIPFNLIDRPSRFDKLIYVGNPESGDRAVLLKEFLHRNVSDEEIRASEGLSIAGLKEACLRALIEDEPLAMALEAMKERAKEAKIRFKKQTREDYDL